MPTRFLRVPSLVRPALFAAASAAAALLGGCGSSAATAPGLTLSCQKSDAVYRQAFPVGVADVRDAGETDVVVTCRTEPSTSAAPGSARTDSASVAAAPAVTQVLHVRMLWQQGFRVKAAMREVSRNASFHWYVYPAGRTDAAAGPAGAGSQVVEYTGTGLVEMSREGETVTLRVAEAKLAPTAVTPGMADPIGPAMLRGTIVARADRQQTLAMLDDLRATEAAARTAAATATPGDAPTGPAGAEAKLPVGQ